MTIKQTYAVLYPSDKKDKRLTTEEWIIAAIYRGWKDKGTFVSYNTIATEWDFSIGFVRNTVNKLEKLGMITKSDFRGKKQKEKVITWVQCNQPVTLTTNQCNPPVTLNVISQLHSMSSTSDTKTTDLPMKTDPIYSSDKIDDKLEARPDGARFTEKSAQANAATRKQKAEISNKDKAIKAIQLSKEKPSRSNKAEANFLATQAGLAKPYTTQEVLNTAL